jgi:LPXTG-motif cell wall-anchored protein
MKKHIAAGAAFAVLASAGIAAAQSSPALGANLYVSPRVERGAQDTLLALVSLSARDSSSGVQVPSLRIDTSFANGAVQGDITDCRVRNVNNLTSALNNGGNAVGVTSGSTVIPLDSPYVVATGTTATLAITCDVASTAALGGTITMSLPPGSQAANVQGSSTTVTVTTGRTTSGSDGPTSGTAQVVVDATPATPSTPTVPGVPNTGNSAAMNLILLAMAGVVALGGFVLARKIASAQ